MWEGDDTRVTATSGDGDEVKWRRRGVGGWDDILGGSSRTKKKKNAVYTSLNNPRGVRWHILNTPHPRNDCNHIVRAAHIRRPQTPLVHLPHISVCCRQIAERCSDMIASSHRAMFRKAAHCDGI